MKSVRSYLCLTFGMAWTIWFVVWICGVKLGTPISQIANLFAMWMPALAYGILRKKEPEHFKLGGRLSIRLKGVWAFYLAALWLPAVFTILGGILYFLIFPAQFSLSFESLKTQLTQAGATTAQLSLSGLVLAQIVSAITVAPLFNSLFALGEEIGWRGYLYPALRQHYSARKSHLLVGLFWSLWHLPINLQGYNYGTAYPAFPFLGILAMFVFCFSVGVCLSWLVEKTGSIWSSAICHGAINASVSLGILFQATSQQTEALRILGPVPTGFLAVLPVFLLALAILHKRREKK